jgi:hypothetical protein
MQRGKILQTSCGIKLTWTKPANGGSPITEFKIAVRGSNGKYVSLPECGTKGEAGPLFCDVSAK